MAKRQVFSYHVDHIYEGAEPLSKVEKTTVTPAVSILGNLKSKKGTSFFIKHLESIDEHRLKKGSRTQLYQSPCLKHI